MNESHPWGDFSNLGDENRKGGWGGRWQKFTVFGYELILDIMELQMKRKTVKNPRGRFAFSNSLKGSILEKSLGNPALVSTIIWK